MNKNKYSSKLLALGIILTVVGLVLSMPFVFYTPSKLLDGATTDVDTLSVDVYHFDEMLVIDKYSYYTYDGWSYDEDYYIVSFYSEKDDTSYLASLKIDESAGRLYNKMNDYINDDTMYVGDCYIDVCVTVDSLSTLDSDIYQYYKEAEEQYAADYKYMKQTDIALTYYCNSPDDFATETQSEMLMARYFAFFFLGIFIIGISLIGEENRKKKIQKTAVAHMWANGAYHTPDIRQDFNNYYTPSQNSEENNYDESRNYTDSGNDYQS